MSRWGTIIVGLALGCEAPQEVSDHGPTADEFTLPSGSYLEMVRLDVDEARVLMVEEQSGTWDVRYGLDWSDSDPIDVFAVNLVGGLTVDGQRMLPEVVEEGQVADGVELVAIDTWEARYGVFPEVAEVEVAEGEWAGTQAFAREVGPVRLTFSGQAWDLVFYE